MKVFIGTYRADKDLVLRCLRGFYDHVYGITNMIFVDDSGDADFRKWLNRYGNVLPVGVEGKEDGQHQGFAKAMDKACELMRDFDDPYVAWWEEDFVATGDINLDSIAETMGFYPNLAQVVLPRQPWFPNEIEAGDVITAMCARLEREIERRDPTGFGVDLLMHDMTFSCNPGVWAPMSWRWTWPQCQASEEEKTTYLVRDDDACFAFWGDRPLVHHDGERQGHGY